MSDYRAIYDAIRDADLGYHMMLAVGQWRDNVSAPHVLMRPRVYIDGNKWIALYGDNIQDGVVGTGDSPSDAMASFDRAWFAKLPSDPPPNNPERAMSASMAEYRNKPIMDLVNRIDQEFGAEASRHVLGLYEEANAWHRTASNLSRGCAEIQSQLETALSRLGSVLEHCRAVDSLLETNEPKTARLRLAEIWEDESRAVEKQEPKQE